MTKTDLVPLGWDAGWEQAARGLGSDDPVAARIGRVDRGRCEIHLGTDPETGLEEVELAHVQLGPGFLPEDQPATGDWVLVERRPEGSVITHVLPRRTQIVRRVAGSRSDGQVLAANVDTILVAASLEAQVRLDRIERLLTLAWESGATPVVVLTKADIDLDPQSVIDEVRTCAVGAEVIAVSSLTGDGLDELEAMLGPTTVLVGPSGVGKSSLVNTLLGEHRMRTLETRQDGKGQHTTVTRELLVRPGGGVLVDTPGLRGIGLHDSAEGLARSFADIEDLAEHCRFADCAHDTEPGCAVRAAIEAGDLTDRRLESYRKQAREIEWAHRRTDPAARAAASKRWAKRAQETRVAVRLKRGE